MNILIIDDDELVASTIASTLAEFGAHRNVWVAEDLDAGLAIANLEKVDLAIVDISLKHNCTGYHAAAELLRNGIRSVFVTAISPPIDIPELALGHMTKPFRTDELLDFVDIIDDVPCERSPSKSLPRNSRIYSPVLESIR